MTEYTQGICEDGAAILKDGQMMTIEEILEALRAAEAKWIKCSERMPRFGQRVILSHKGIVQFYMPTFESSDEGCFWDFDGVADEEPSPDIERDQWMPLPEPPATGSD